jgi:hypothetical protein
MCENKTVFEVEKTYKTRDGRDARVICVDADLDGGQQIIALVDKYCDGRRNTYNCFHANGHYFLDGTNHMCDLMPPMRTVWVNFFKSGNAFFHETKQKAEHHEGGGSIATAIPVEIPA